jgi:hypothetical protein
MFFRTRLQTFVESRVLLVHKFSGGGGEMLMNKNDGYLYLKIKPISEPKAIMRKLWLTVTKKKKVLCKLPFQLA